MACSVCKNPNAVCADVQGPPCHVTIPMISSYREQVHVPCVSGHLIGYMIERAYSKTIQKIIIIGNPLFKTKQSLQYEVSISQGEETTTIHGAGWKKLLDDYAVCSGDTIHICCPHRGPAFYVDVERDGIQLTPLHFVGGS